LVLPRKTRVTALAGRTTVAFTTLLPAFRDDANKELFLESFFVVVTVAGDIACVVVDGPEDGGKGVVLPLFSPTPLVAAAVAGS
jgi:hypothetical protein